MQIGAVAPCNAVLGNEQRGLLLIATWLAGRLAESVTTCELGKATMCMVLNISARFGVETS